MTFAPDDQLARDQAKAKNEAVEQLRREYHADENEAELWYEVSKHNSFFATASNPEDAYTYFTADPNRAALPDVPYALDPSWQQALTAARGPLIETIEKAYAADPNLNLTVWFADSGYDPQIIEYLGFNEYVSIPYIEQVRQQTAWAWNLEQEIQAEAERRWTERNRRENFLFALTAGATGAMDFLMGSEDPTLQQMEREVRDELTNFTATGELPEPEDDGGGGWASRVGREIIRGATAVSNNWISLLVGSRKGIQNTFQTWNELGESNTAPELMDIVYGGMDEFGTGIGGLATGVGGSLWAVDGILPGSSVGPLSPYDSFVDQHLSEQAELQAAAEAFSSEPVDPEIMEMVETTTVAAAFDRVEQEYPDVWQEYMDMAGGDHIMAMGFFGATFTENETVRAQMAEAVQDAHDREEYMLEELAEQDFRFSSEMMDLLAMWGRNVPGRFATAFTLLLSDSDMHDLALSGQFKALWDALGEESSRLDHTPSAALGIDGTAVGLAYDLGMGIAFDPTTYLFGPKFTGFIRNVAANEVKALAGSAVMGRWVDDTIRLAMSDARGVGAYHNVIGWMDNIGIREMFDTVGFTNRQLPAQPWRRAFPEAREMSTDTVLRRIWNSRDDVAQFPLEDLGGLTDDILENGFKEPITLTVSRADETIHVTDGVKRLAAAEAADLKRVPVRVRVVDDAAAEVRRIPGYTPEEVDLIQRLAGDVEDLKMMARAETPNTRLKSGSDTVARDRLLTDPKIREIVDSPSTNKYEIGTVEGRKGEQYRLTKAATEEGDVIYFAEDEAGEWLAATIGAEGKNAPPQGILIGANRKGALLMEQIWDLARQSGDDFLIQSTKGTIESISDAGLKFVNRYAKKIDDTRVGNLRTVGKPLDEALPEGLAGELDDIANSVGEAYYDPNKVFRFEDINPEISREKVQNIIERALLRGARPADAARRGILIGQNGMIRDIVKKLVPKEVRSLFTQANTTTKIPLGNTREVIEQAVKIWGDDVAKADEWVSRIYEAQGRATDQIALKVDELAVVHQNLDELSAMQRVAGGDWDDAWSKIPEGDVPGVQQARANQSQLNEAMQEKWRELEKNARAAHKKLDTLPDTNELHALVREMWEDYNRTYIVPRWKNEIDAMPEIFDEDLGIVKWDHLQKGLKPEKYIAPGEQGWLPESLADDLMAAGVDNPERMARQLNSVLDTPLSTNVPLSPLDLIAAGTRSGKAWTKYTKLKMVGAVREMTHAVNRAWVIDKVLRPATAMTVSGDELLRIFHKGGHHAMKRYINDRLLFTQARVQHMLHGGNPVSRESVRQGARYSERVRERLAALDYHTTQARQWERIFYDGYGNGWVDVLPGSPEYLDAAKMWTGQMMQQSGFRAFLRGEDAFREWFFSLDGQQLRNGTLMGRGGTTTPISSVDEAYRGWQTLFDDVILKRARKDGVYDEVRSAFNDIASQIDDVGGKPIDLPDWVYNHLGAVRGIEKYNRRQLSLFRMTDRFFDQFFLDPVNYRRGFVADMVATTERARLESLYSSQGIRILSDMEVAEALGYKGVKGAVRTGVSDFVAEQALRRGMVPESYVDSIVQRAVDAEIEHMLYVTDKASRAGNIVTGTLFPFGKPYADMMGFWGREMFRRPHFRGVINDENMFNLGNIATAGGNFNPRTPALISRLAHTDFNIDQGWTGMEEGETAGLIPGSESTNLSPLLFLPTKGENPFYSMLPGLGYIPMWAIDVVLGELYDPVEDPLAYQEAINDIGDIIPGVFFGNPDPAKAAVQRIVGGGTFGQATEALLDVNRLFGGGGDYHQIASWFGQPDREIDRGRYMSAVLADPAEWEALFELGSQEEIQLYLDALASEADTNAARGNLAEQSGRFLTPTSSKYAGELDQIWEVWLDASKEFDVLADDRYDDATATPGERTQYVASVRSRFFDLPQWQRDAFIAAKPEMAVNLISTWDWTDEAYSDGVAGGTAYRTGGSREDLARHQTYIRMSYIRPLSPQERGRRIVGLALAAKESTAKRIYEYTTQSINEAVWENAVSEGTKLLLGAILDENPEWAKTYDVQSPRELWDVWSRYEEDVEIMLAEGMDIDPVRGESTRKEDQTVFDALRAFISVPTKEKPWGTSWPGVDPENLSKRFGELILTDDLFTDEVREMAKILGVELVPEMTGEQLYYELQQVEVSTTGPLAAFVDPAYQTYLGERSAAYRVADENIREIAFNQKYDPAWRKGVTEFIEFSDRTSSRYRDEALGVPPSRQLEVQDRYMKLMNTADDNVVADWQQLWELRYERAFGPLGWTPPVPRPALENGEPINGAYQPYIKRIIDGDSLLVTTFPGEKRTHEVRLLGVRARDFGLDDDGAEQDKDRLWDRLQQALRDGDRIWLVRDPDNFGNVDIYGRELAWLWIEDESFSFPEEMLPNRDPSGS